MISIRWSEEEEPKHSQLMVVDSITGCSVAVPSIERVAARITENNGEWDNALIGMIQGMTVIVEGRGLIMETFSGRGI